MKIRQSETDRLFDAVNYALLILILLVVLYPLIYVISASFSSPDMLVRGEVWLLPKGLTLASYQAVLKDKFILRGYLISIVVTAGGTLLSLSVTFLAAYSLSRKDFAGKSFIMFIFAFTMFFSGGMIPKYMVVRDLQLINSTWSLVLPSLVSVYNLIVVRTFFSNTIPYELQEAAFIDGCSNRRLFFTIIMPLSLPIVAVMVIFYGVGYWNSYFNAIMYITDRNKFPLQLVLRDILLKNQLQTMMSTTDIISSTQALMFEGIKYAVIVVASLPVLLIYPFVQKYFVKGVMIGAIKG